MLNKIFFESLKSEPNISGSQNFLFVLPFMTLIAVVSVSNSAISASKKNEFQAISLGVGGIKAAGPYGSQYYQLQCADFH
jgi:hypothetical protein